MNYIFGKAVGDAFTLSMPSSKRMFDITLGIHNGMFWLYGITMGTQLNYSCMGVYILHSNICRILHIVINTVL